MTGRGPACLHSEEVSVWEGLAAWEDAYEQVPESSGEPGHAGSSLSRCLAQTQHCAHPQHDGRETPEQTAVQRGLLASGHQMTQSGRWTQEGAVGKSPWLEGSSCAGGGLGSQPGSWGELHQGSTAEAGREDGEPCMLQRCSCNENPACTSEDQEDEDPGSPRGLPPDGGWMSPGPRGTHGGSHLGGRLGKVTIFTQSLLSSGSGKEGGKHLC